MANQAYPSPKAAKPPQKQKLTDAPTNLKEAIDWVLRVTGRDGKKNGECICGLAAAVTDLLQSVTLEYHGYEGNKVDDDEAKRVKGLTDNLFSLVQGLGGTAVVRTYIDQLAQVLSALVGWSRIEKCEKYQCEVKSGQCNAKGMTGHSVKKCCCKNYGTTKHLGSPGCCKGGSGILNCKNNRQCTDHANGCNVICANGCCSHGGKGCKYLNPVVPNDPCDKCECMRWNLSKGQHLGRGCTRCSDEKKDCKCNPGDDTQCSGTECPCAKDGKCCKCCCNSEHCKENCQKYAKCSCSTEEPNGSYCRTYNESYQSAYGDVWFESNIEGNNTTNRPPIWNDLKSNAFGATKIQDGLTPSQRRQQCAQIFLGSVCLIWSGITYMYWTGKNHATSPRWNNHILDGTGLDDGTLSQWLQALGFPKDMLNNSGPGNRLDQVITDELKERLFIGYKAPSGSGLFISDRDGNTAREPAGMNFAGFVHAMHRDSFNNEANVFHGTDTNIHKRGPLYKLYILSGAYFTGLQKTTTHINSNKTPKTIREILYWLCALPYSQAYPEILNHSKERLKEALPDYKEGDDNKNKLDFTFQAGKTFTVRKVDLYAHFQAVTQYCPLVLIGIQGGLKGTDSTKEPAIHSLYANTECNFTYPTVPIQAYNQVVHYIRGLFYQLYFLRKQCAVKVTSGGKWRECRYGKDVESKGVISWMCLGCSPMEHDMNYRVENMKKGLVGLVDKVRTLEWKTQINAVRGGLVDKMEKGDNAKKLKDLLEKIGDVVVQLGNAQEALEGKAKKTVIEGVKAELEKAKRALEGARKELEAVANGEQKLKDANNKLGELMDGRGKGALDILVNSGSGSLAAVSKDNEKDRDYNGAKNKISAAIDGIHKSLVLIKGWAEQDKDEIICHLKDPYNDFLKAIDDLTYICSTPKCHHCSDHAKKCGKKPVSRYCNTCHQQYMDGTPSPLQAFLEDRLPGFSCELVRNNETDQPYPPAASHLWHSNGTGQCCPLPMGFRGQFCSGSITNCTGSRLYGILYFFSDENMMESCVYRLVRVTSALSATTPQVLGDVFGFFRGGIGEKGKGWANAGLGTAIGETDWIRVGDTAGEKYKPTLGKALIEIKGEKGSHSATQQPSTKYHCDLSSLSECTHGPCAKYISPLTGELYTAVSATFGHVYLQWVLYLSDALHLGLQSLSEAFRKVECRGCRECDPNKCKKGSHGETGGGQCGCQSIVSCTGVLPVLYRHGFSYGNPFNLEGYQQKDKDKGDYSITDKDNKTVKRCHEFLDSLKTVIERAEKGQDKHPLTKLLSEVGKLQYDIRLPWIFVLTVAWLVAVLYLAFGAIWPLDWTHMRSHWLRGGAHQWQCMWYKVMTGRKGRVVQDVVEYFGGK